MGLDFVLVFSLHRVDLMKVNEMSVILNKQLWHLVWIVCWGLLNKIISLLLLLSLLKEILLMWVWCLECSCRKQLEIYQFSALEMWWSCSPRLCSVPLLLISCDLAGPYCKLHWPVFWPLLSSAPIASGMALQHCPLVGWGWASSWEARRTDPNWPKGYSLPLRISAQQ